MHLWKPILLVAGSLFTLALLVPPRAPAVFAVAFIGENVFQALAITTSVAITFETIGRKNPLAATTFCLLITAFSVPITYMLFVDGLGYAKQGVAGSFAADASVGVIASILGALLQDHSASPLGVDSGGGNPSLEKTRRFQTVTPRSFGSVWANSASPYLQT